LVSVVFVCPLKDLRVPLEAGFSFTQKFKKIQKNKSLE